MSKISTIKEIRDIIRNYYGLDALRIAKEIYENSFNKEIIIVENESLDTLTMMSREQFENNT